MDGSITPRDVALNEIYFMQVFIEDSEGNGKPGLKIPYFIYQAKGGYLRKQGRMIEDFNAPGVYVQSYIFTKLGQHRIIYRPPAPYPDMIEIINVTDGMLKIRVFQKHFHRHYIRKSEPKIPKK